VNAEIITSGTELLLGRIVDTNSAWLSVKLAEAGINVYYRTTAGDNAGRLVSVINSALERADLVIITGGLGPTVDDLTRQVVSEVTGRKLIRHPEIILSINEMFKKTGRAVAVTNEVQADIPEGAIILNNNHGSAPGFIVEYKGKILAAMPGVPREMKPMFEQQVLPFIRKRSGVSGVIKFIEMKVAGMPESLVDEKIKDLFESCVNPSIGVMCRTDEIVVRVTASAKDSDEADTMIAGVKEKVAGRLNGFYYADEPVMLQELLGKELKAKGMMISTAESCTSGMIAARITETAGSSSYYKGGINAYSNEVKSGILGVDGAIIEKYGAVSEECCREMAHKCAEKFKTQAALSVTGIAGPDGGSAEKPVGLVYTGIYLNGTTKVFRNVFTGERESVRTRAATTALFMMLKALRGEG